MRDIPPYLDGVENLKGGERGWGEGGGVREEGGRWKGVKSQESSTSSLPPLPIHPLSHVIINLRERERGGGEVTLGTRKLENQFIFVNQRRFTQNRLSHI